MWQSPSSSHKSFRDYLDMSPNVPLLYDLLVNNSHLNEMAKCLNVIRWQSNLSHAVMCFLRVPIPFENPFKKYITKCRKKLAGVILCSCFQLESQMRFQMPIEFAPDCHSISANTCDLSISQPNIDRFYSNSDHFVPYSKDDFKLPN